MLTTGFDAPEVQNIVLARPVFEPTLYQQIKVAELVCVKK
jgi:type I site-specific restriction endonuclease